MYATHLETFRILRPDAGRDVGSPLEMALELRTGLPVDGLENVRRETGLPLGELLAIAGLSESTVKRRRSSGGRLPTEATDVLYRLLQLFARARTVLGTVDAARAWFLAPSRALGHHRPLDLVSSALGGELLRDELDAIEHGFLA